jgi:hypothetical protein
MARQATATFWIWLAAIAAGGSGAACNSSSPPASPDAAVADSGAVGPDGAPADGGPDARADAPIDDAKSDTAADAELAADGGDATLSDAAPDAPSDLDSSLVDAGAAETGITEAGITEAGDAAGETTLSVLAAISPDCLACAEASQTLETQGTCEDLIGSVAQNGPATGTSRISLCLDTLSCVLSHACTDLPNADDLACYCGANCEAGTPNGPCEAIEQSGTEQTSSADVENPTNYYSLVFGAGRANSIVTTLAYGGCRSCFPGE